MSLVVCSNQLTGDADRDYDRTSTNQAAYRFTNHLVSPLEIPKDSEVAVQSVKVNKDGQIKIGAHMKWFQFLNVGLRDNSETPIIDEVNKTPCFPIECSVKLDNRSMDEYVSIYELTERIRRGMERGLPHPDYMGSGLSTCKILRDNGSTLGSGFKGFELKYKYRDGQFPNAADKLNPPVQADWARLFPNDGVNRISVSADGKTITANHTGATLNEAQKNCIWGQNKPLSHQKGLCSFDLRNVGTINASGDGTYNYTSFDKDFIVGLNRAVPLYQGNNFNMEAGYNRGDNTFTKYHMNPFDYAFSCEQSGAGGNRWARLGHLVEDPVIFDEDHPLAMDDIQYYKGTAPLEWTDSNFGGAGHPAAEPEAVGRYNMSSNASHFDTITFEIENEIMTISMERLHSRDNTADYGKDSAAYPLKVIMASFNLKATNPNGYHKRCCPKPVAQTCWNLYPKLMLPISGQSVALSSYYGRDTGYKAQSTYGDYYCRLLEEGRMNYLMEIDRREYNQMTEAAIYNQKGCSGAADKQHFNHYIVQVILTEQDLNYQYTQGANMARFLGFFGRGVLNKNNASRDDNAQQVLYQSDQAPDLIPYDSMFIRLDNFTQKSYNAGVGRPSKILYHLPRFDTSNRELGAGLYYEPHERTYIKLGNTNPITINELDFSISNNKEQLIKDLTGQTIICLHFRHHKCD